MLILSALTHGFLAVASGASTVASSASNSILSTSSILGVLLGILALAAIAGVVIAYAKTNLTEKTVQLWKDQSEALEKRLEEVEKSSNEKDIRIKKQDDEIALLREMVSGGNAIKALGEKLDTHHEDLMHAITTGERRS